MGMKDDKANRFEISVLKKNIVFFDSITINFKNFTQSWVAQLKYSSIFTPIRNNFWPLIFNLRSVKKNYF